MTTATQHDLVSPRIEERLRQGNLTKHRSMRFAISWIASTATCYIIASSLDNAYTRWFQAGQATDAELVHFVRQFSVFSNQFLVAALLRVINAPSLQQARAAKEILLNELGVIYRRTDGEASSARARMNDECEGPGRRPRAGQHRGTVDGGMFRFRAAHFEWLLAVGEALGLGFR